MKIYIAGAYSNGDVAENVRSAIHAGDCMTRLGHVPFIPHLTHFWHMMLPHDYEFWIIQNEQWLLSCDAVLRLDGESAGADREVNKAIELGLPVYTSILDVPVNVEKKTYVESFAELRKIVDNAYDDVDDVVGYVNSLRRDE